MEKRLCSSCGTDISVVPDSVRFPCPNCGKEIRRCAVCRKSTIKYECECGFEGP